MKIKLPSWLSLSEGLQHGISPSFSWVTFLTVGQSSLLQDVDLLSISRLPNLGMLSLVDLGREALRDSLVRAWSRAASEAGAFSKMRIFRCDSKNCFTSQTFFYLKALPVLRMLLFSRASLPSGMDEIRAHWQLMRDLDGNGPHSNSWHDVYNSDLCNGRVETPGQGSAQCPDGSTEPPALALLYGQVQAPALSVLVGHRDSQVFIRQERAIDNGKCVLQFGEEEQHGINHTNGSGKKKRAVRQSKQRTMGDMLAEFGS
ncbi:MAG: hypothetical protein Q9174_003289 [Haloplaca sp. 1 TL-2023]